MKDRKDDSTIIQTLDDGNEQYKGLGFSVTTVTKVTDPEWSKQHNLENIYRSYPHSDTWKCKNCNVRDDKWYMLIHPCKNNKK